MANIDRIVRVNILLRSAGVRQISFSDMALMGQHAGPDRVYAITRSDQLLLTPFNVAATDDLYRAAEVAFSQIPSPQRVYILKRNPAEAVNVALAACAAQNNDWYGFSEVSHSEVDLPIAAAWAEANTKLFCTAISDVDVTSTTGVEPATALKQSNFFRTAWWYNIDPDQFPEVAAMARAFSILPGGESWADMQLAAVSSPPLSEAAYINITAKNGNTFEQFRNIAITQNGITAGGEWIDVIRFRDWLCEEVRTSVFNRKINNRIPYTDEGIAVIRQAVEAALDLGVRRKGIPRPERHPDFPDKIIPSYTVNVPLSTQVSQSDRAARILRDVGFTARLAGAIHAVDIIGTLTYDNIG